MIRACACRPVKEEEGAGLPKGSNSLSGRELRALMRSNQATDKGKQDNEPGSTKGEHTDKILESLQVAHQDMHLAASSSSGASLRVSAQAASADLLVLLSRSRQQRERFR